MPALFKSANACNLLRRNLLLDTWLASREIIEHSQLRPRPHCLAGCITLPLTPTSLWDGGPSTVRAAGNVNS